MATSEGASIDWLTPASAPRGPTHAGREIIKTASSRPCPYCQAIGQWHLVKRCNAGGVWNVGLQCQTCGTFTGSGMKRADHPGWEGYDEYDDEARGRWYRQREQQWSETQDERRRQQQERSQAYGEWLRTSVEWRELRAKVIYRAGNRCEACFANAPLQVHHISYLKGKLPPAWMLRAVCEECHDRLHNVEDEWGAA